MKRLVDKWKILIQKQKGLSNRRVAEELGIDRKTVAKYWKEYNL